ncbi:hypothetical protein SSE37_02925 [Sagittula stellata E-37]|uniref:Uncharacterized protein n=1 Tax=Sagittula stellata (strain ATCC 700073 / DSM 11524 / E-37) TaxID=388399 RepID=A3K834_SAGS3|nr:hypothetical protein SSE37_02925 [Sagittula stellata E-37]
MARCRFHEHEGKIRSIRLVPDGGVAVVQASPDLDVEESVLPCLIKAAKAAPAMAFPSNCL